MITTHDYAGKWGPMPPEVLRNSVDLLARVNQLLVQLASAGLAAAKKPVVNSGWRPPAHNATVPGASATSKHMTGQAIDLGDPEGELDDYLSNRLNLLEAAGLWLEHPASTKNWCHLQSVPPRSGNRVFYP